MLASDEQLRSFLTTPGKIAIVGASTKTSKAGYYVPEFLQKRGFDPIPINPHADEVFGKKTLKSLDDLQEDVLGVIIYRVTSQAEKEAIKAVDKGIPFVWLPLGVSSQKAEEYANEKGITYLHDRCPIPESRRLGI
ncbi:MAG: CoA-binding protein [Candidatus Kariarchaeaceae archaeon]